MDGVTLGHKVVCLCVIVEEHEVLGCDGARRGCGGGLWWRDEGGGGVCGGDEVPNSARYAHRLANRCSVCVDGTGYVIGALTMKE